MDRRRNPEADVEWCDARPADGGSGGSQGAQTSGLATPMGPEQLYTPLDLADVPEAAQQLVADQIRRNHYFTRVEVLPGNIGYIDYDLFGMPNFSTAAADAAFAFLQGVDALVLDLRNNRGGAEGMNQYIASHFFGTEPVHLYSRYLRDGDTEHSYMSFPEVVKHRFEQQPLFVLVNGGTGSAAENLTYALQGLGRATVVGEPTAGGAHSATLVTVADIFSLQLPIARAFNPRTGEDWEGDGVQPDVSAEGSAAMVTAHGLAIDALAKTADDQRRSELEESKLLFAARHGPQQSFDAGELAGSYGNRRVWMENGSLKMQRTDVEGAPAIDLIPVGPDRFAVEQLAGGSVAFERDGDGNVVRVRVGYPDGRTDASDRDP